MKVSAERLNMNFSYWCSHMSSEVDPARASSRSVHPQHRRQQIDVQPPMQRADVSTVKDEDPSIHGHGMQLP